MDAHQLDLKGSFDYIILSDLVNDLWNVQQVFGKIRAVCNPENPHPDQFLQPDMVSFPDR